MCVNYWLYLYTVKQIEYMNMQQCGISDPLYLKWEIMILCI